MILPNYSGYVWVKRLPEKKPELAYFISQSGRALSQSFQSPGSVKDYEGLSIEYYDDVVEWCEAEPPKDAKWEKVTI